MAEFDPDHSGNNKTSKVTTWWRCRRAIEALATLVGVYHVVEFILAVTNGGGGPTC